MKPKLFKMIIIYSLFILTVTIFMPVGQTGAVDRSPELDMTLSPQEYLFNIGNMKPGDWANRTLTVKNNGNKDFHYTVEVKQESGSEMLYNQLDVQVFDAEGILFEGKLNELKELESRFLTSHSKHPLKFSVMFPVESGNEYQGLATEVALIFSAEGAPGEQPPEDNGQEPPVSGDPKDDSSGGDSLLDSVLPQTGETNPLYYYLSGLAMILIGFAAYNIKKSNVKNDD